MPALRLLSQLFLVALGTTLGAFTISGYFEPHMQHGQPVAAVAGPTAPGDRSTLAIAKPRKRFVAVDAEILAEARGRQVRQARAQEEPGRRGPGREGKAPAPGVDATALALGPVQQLRVLSACLHRRRLCLHRRRPVSPGSSQPQAPSPPRYGSRPQGPG